MFTDEQKKSAARWLMTIVGGMVAGWVSKTGIISSEQVMSFFTSETIIGFLVTGMTAGIALVWSFFTHTDKNAVAVVDTLAQQPGSPVKGVLMEPTKEGRDIADALPGNTTVVAGSTAATNIARAA